MATAESRAAFRLSPAGKKKLLIAVGAALLLAVGCFFLISGVLGPSGKYKEACALLDAGNYSAAESSFAQLEDYRDAPQKVLECRRLQAEACIEAKDYEALYALVERTGLTPDLSSLLNEAVCGCIEKDDFEAVYSLMGAVTADAALENQLKEALYQRALQHFDAGNLEISNGVFTWLGDYKDSAQKLHQHAYTAAQTAAPACEAEGTTTYTCGCGHSYTEAIAPSGHSYADASCTAAKTCTVCKKTEGAALGHNTVDHVCSRCGAVQITLDDLQGSWKNTWGSSHNTGYEIVTVSGSTATIERYTNFYGEESLTYAVGSVQLTDYGFYAEGTYQYYTASGELQYATIYLHFGITKLTPTYLTENYNGDTETWYKQ